MMFDINSIPVPIFVLDEQALLRDCNRAVEAMYGLKKEELVARLSEILVVEEKRTITLNTAFGQLFAQGTEGQVLTKHKLVDGTLIDVDVVWQLSTYNGAKTMVVCVRDFTEQQLLQDQLLIKTRELERLANLDPLTGIYNRLYFNTRLESEIARAKRYNECLTLLMIDVDHFKCINDQYGHLVGDQVLVKVAESLKAGLRRSDVLVRFGGEEFAIVAPNTNLQGGKLLAEMIQNRVSATKVSYLEATTEVTVSIGIATVNFAEQDVAVEMAKHLLVKNADDKLYKAKNAGRNLIEY